MHFDNETDLAAIEYGHTLKNDLILMQLSIYEQQASYGQLKKLLVDDIERECHGLVEQLRTHLQTTYKLSNDEISEILARKLDESSTDALKFTIKCYHVERERRKYAKELGCCLKHHCGRCFHCGKPYNSQLNFLYQFVRFLCLCCWTSYVWRLTCFQCSSERHMAEQSGCGHKSFHRPRALYFGYLFTHCCCCLFLCCYNYDRKNFESSVQEQQANATMRSTAGDFDESVVVAVQRQPQPSVPFRYTNKFFSTVVYAAVESTSQTAIMAGKNDLRIFWIKFPFEYNIDLGVDQDCDLF